jgi:hypothetical protein
MNRLVRKRGVWCSSCGSYESHDPFEWHYQPPDVASITTVTVHVGSTPWQRLHLGLHLLEIVEARIRSAFSHQLCKGD